MQNEASPVIVICMVQKQASSDPNDAGLLRGEVKPLNAMWEVNLGQEALVVPRHVPIIVEERVRTAERI